MTNPQISIITATFNCEDTIEQSILSVLSQDYENIEYIVIDGGSTDRTLDYIRQYSNKISYWVSEPDKGLYDALNKGIQVASGDWIGLLNSGDIFHSNHTISDLFVETISPFVGVIYGDSVLVDGKNEIYKRAMASKSSRIPPDYRHGASFVKAEIHKQFLFDLAQSRRFSYGLDYLHICTLYQKSIPFLYRNVVVIDYLQEGLSNHPWKNKYIRALAESGGEYNTFFFMRLISYLYNSLINKIRK